MTTIYRLSLAVAGVVILLAALAMPACAQAAKPLVDPNTAT